MTSEMRVTPDPHAETIVAIATPPGVGAVGIVRLSGPEAFAIGGALFRPSGYGRAPANSAHEQDWLATQGRVTRPDGPSSTPSSPQSHLLTYGQVIDPATGEVVDEALVAFMRAPHTYTREDVVEINAHGGPALLRRIVGLALARRGR